VLPVWIFVGVAIPLLVIGFVAMRRSTEAGEHPTAETDADRLRTEREFEESERYQAEWREQQHEHHRDPPLS
jgi:hypothetical protein